MASSPREIETRVNTTDEEIARQISTIRIVDPKG